MNQLPAHRALVNGRTWGRYWRPEDYCAIEHHRAESTAERIGGVILAVVIGIVMAAALWHWAAQ
jgi:hypothetical protein